LFLFINFKKVLTFYGKKVNVISQYPLPFAPSNPDFINSIPEPPDVVRFSSNKEEKP
jgi:hypothetical protein